MVDALLNQKSHAFIAARNCISYFDVVLVGLKQIFRFVSWHATQHAFRVCGGALIPTGHVRVGFAVRRQLFSSSFWISSFACDRPFFGDSAIECSQPLRNTKKKTSNSVLKFSQSRMVHTSIRRMRLMGITGRVIIVCRIVKEKKIIERFDGRK